MSVFVVVETDACIGWGFESACLGACVSTASGGVGIFVGVG